MVGAVASEVKPMEIHDGLLFVVDRAIDRLRPSVQHDLQLLVVVRQELDCEQAFSYRTADSPSLSSINADGYPLPFHIHDNLHVIAPIADLFPHILRVLLNMTFAEVIHQKRDGNIVDIQQVATLLQRIEQGLLMCGAKRSIQLVVQEIGVLYHLPEIGLVGGQTLYDEFL